MNLTNDNTKPFGLICGVRRGMVVNVTGNYVLLTFHSNGEVQRKGFLLFFTALPLPGKWKVSKTVRLVILSNK